MAETEIAAGIDLSVNVQNALKGIQAVDKSTENLVKSFQDVSAQVDAVIQRIEKLTTVASKANRTVNNTRNDYQNSTFTNQNNFSNATYAATSATGASMVSPTGSDKAFKDFQKAQIDETNARIELTNEIKEDTKERKRLRKYRANTERISASAAQTKANKKEDQTTAEYIADRAKLADAKLLNAKANQAGALNKNWRYQIGRGVTQVGDKLSTMGTGGRIGGDLLSVVGKSIISPASAAGLAIAKLGEGVLDFAKAATTAYAEIESIKTQLGVVFSSQSQADSMFGELSVYATKSPFGVQQTSELAVLLKQSGVYASDLLSTLKMIGDTAGGNMEKMKRIANNYAQIMSIGKASMLDMRQFAYAGIPIFEAVSKELKVSQSTLREMISDGKVSSEVIEKVFKDLTGVNGIFNNATLLGSKTVKSRLQNLSDEKQLAMASVGNSFWNLGGTSNSTSIAKQFLTSAENFYKSINNLSSNFVDSQTYAYAKSSFSLLEDLKKAYKQALQDENPKLAEAIGQQIAIIRSSEFNESSIRAEFAKQFLKDNGLDNKKIISNENYLRLENEIIDILKKYGKVLGNGGYRNPNISEINKFLDTGNLSTASIALRGAPRTLLDNLYSEYSSVINKGAVNVSLLNAGQSANGKIDFEKLNNAFAYRGSELEKSIISFSESADKLGKKSDSLFSLSEKANQEFKHSKEGQEEEKKEKERKDAELAEFYNKMSSMYDSNINRVKASEIRNLESLSAFYESGFVGKVTALKGTEEYLSGSENADNVLEIEKNVENVLQILSALRKSGDLSSKDTDKIEQQLGFILNTIGTGMSPDGKFKGLSNGNARSLQSFLYEIADIANDFSDDNVLKKLLGDIFVKYTETASKPRFASDEKKGKDLPDYIPLWKRIVANATGWDASLVGNSGSGFIDKYSNQAARNVVTGGVQGLVSSGAMAGDILSRMRYDDEQNKQGVRQINWKKTESDMIKDALSLKDGVKMSASALSGLSKALESQLSVYEKLTVDMIGVGEDWATIQNSLNEKFANNPYLKEGNFLDNAFQASAKNIGGYSLGYDSELGMIVKDSTGATKGSVEELKKSSNTLSGDLKEFVDSIKVDTIVEALDNLRKSTMSLNDTVSLANSLANQSVDFRNRAGQLRGEAWGNSIGAMSAMSVSAGNRTVSKGAKNLLSEYMTGFAGKLASYDTLDNATIDKIFKDNGGESTLGKNQYEAIRQASENFKNAGFDYQKQTDAMKHLFDAFGIQMKELIEAAEDAAQAEEGKKYSDAASNALKNNYFDSWTQAGNKYAYLQKGNSITEQNLMTSLGLGDMSFSKMSANMTQQVFADKKLNPESTQYAQLLNGYKEAGGNFIKDTWGEGEWGQFNTEGFNAAIDSGNLEEARRIIESMGGNFDEMTNSVNKTNLAFDDMAHRLSDLGANLGNLLEDFAGNAVSSTMETWGKSLAEGADSSKSLMENFRQLGAGLMQNMGTMITQAGLSMAIHASSKGEVLAGLAIAAAGAGASFLGGYLSADKSEDEGEEDEYQRLSKIKDDLADLLKQAREDAIYYENTLRHKNAISANDSFTQKKVNDAIITPSGDIISTHPDDYLIATKTPQTLLGSGAGAPTINFSVIDKSTGIKVTQQKSTYNENDNSIDFTAIIESKVNEIIASSKGDDAFAAREARLRGRSVIA